MWGQPKNLLKIVMIGDPEVGKTSLHNQIFDIKFVRHYKPTIGPDFRTKEFFIEEEKYTLQIWDTEGLERFQGGLPPFRGTSCCVLVYDITNSTSLETLEWRKVYFFERYAYNTENFPFVLIGNKLDKESERKVTTDEAKAWCEKHNIKHYFEVSAKENIMIEEAFQIVAEAARAFCKENEEKPLPLLDDQYLDNKSKKSKISSCLC